MLEKIQNDLKNAMKQKDELRLSVLRMLSSVIHNREIEKKAKGEKELALATEEIVVVIRSEVKKRKDAVTGFMGGGRPDAAEKEAAEAKILESYLPAELSDEDVERVVEEVVAEMGEASMKDFGRVMGEAMKRLKGQASGDRVNSFVKRLLESR